MSSFWKKAGGFALALAGSVAVCAAVAGGTQALMARGQTAPAHYDNVRAMQVFASRCAACHSTGSVAVERLGPNLADVGRTAAARRPGQSASAYLLESLLDPPAFIAPGEKAVMPAGIVADLTDREIRSLVAYLSGLGGTPDYKAIDALSIRRQAGDKLDPLTIDRATAELGSELLIQNCARCHGLSSEPEFNTHAPPLFGVSLRDPARLEAIWAPSAAPRTVDHPQLFPALTQTQKQAIHRVIQVLN